MKDEKRQSTPFTTFSLQHIIEPSRKLAKFTIFLSKPEYMWWSIYWGIERCLILLSLVK